MLSKVKTCVLNGLEGVLVEVETDVSIGMPVFNIVGLADVSIRESKERVRAAINNSGYQFPISRITTNLVPANIKKEGSHLDLPVAIGLLSSIGSVLFETENTAFIGELSLDGNINRIDGALPAVIYLKEKGIKRVVVPRENRDEVGIVKGIDIIAVENLNVLVDYLNGNREIEPYSSTSELRSEICKCDYSDIMGQTVAKRAMEIAAAGFHNLLMVGPRGSGKTMLAKRLPSIMPNLTFEESIEITKIYSVAGMLGGGDIIGERPFRSPHHTVSPTALCGGGRTPKPGEVSLAHRGVLFLDEFPEFQKSAIEVLRQPLEDREISISRVNGRTKYPSDIMLVAAMNPCSCGNYGTEKNCSCTQSSINRYLSKISGPVLDRIDLQIEVERVKYSELSGTKKGETSQSIRKRVESAREIQLKRYGGMVFNAQLSSTEVKKYCVLNRGAKDILKEAFHSLGLSARAYDKVLKVSRTIADLSGGGQIEEVHLAEAIQYRNLDRKYWS